MFSLIDKSGIEVDHNPLEPVPNADKIATLLSLLAKYASLDRFVYHAHDGRSMVNLKWEKTLTDVRTGPYVPTFGIN